MKAKIKGVKVNLKDWQSIDNFAIKTFTQSGVKVTYEIHIHYPRIDEKPKRKVFTYEKEKDMMLDYNKLIIKVLLK